MVAMKFVVLILISLGTADVLVQDHEKAELTPNFGSDDHHATTSDSPKDSLVDFPMLSELVISEDGVSDFGSDLLSDPNSATVSGHARPLTTPDYTDNEVKDQPSSDPIHLIEPRQTGTRQKNARWPLPIESVDDGLNAISNAHGPPPEMNRGDHLGSVSNAHGPPNSREEYTRGEDEDFLHAEPAFLSHGGPGEYEEEYEYGGGDGEGDGYEDAVLYKSHEDFADLEDLQQTQEVHVNTEL